MNKPLQQVKSLKIKLVIGLGNPNLEYQNTYHNVGFLFIDYLEKNPPPTTHYLLPTAKLLKSDVYMNESGSFAKKALKKYGAKQEEILIVHDDNDLAMGSFKLSFDHGSAGHNGVESIIKTLGTKKFWRLRIGIQPQSQTNAKKIDGLHGPPARRTKAGEFVLKTIRKGDQEILLGVFQKIVGLGSTL